jgi:hypothetical protein
MPKTTITFEFDTYEESEAAEVCFKWSNMWDALNDIRREMRRCDKNGEEPTTDEWRTKLFEILDERDIAHLIST